MAIKVFLKQLGNEYNDMELLRRGILDSAKSDRAQVIAKEFRKLVRECDDAASDGNVGKITENFSNVAGLMDEYLSLLQDVPDEL